MLAAPKHCVYLLELLANASFYGGLITSSLHDNHTNSYILIKGIINNQLYDPMSYEYCAIKNCLLFPIRDIPQILQNKKSDKYTRKGT